jgi:hypothetical protein
MTDAVVATNPTTVNPTQNQVTPTEGAIANAPDIEGMTKAEAREEIRKFKVKVKGQEVEVDENELKRGYSHQQAANKEMQEAKRMKSEAQSIIDMLKDEGKLMEAVRQLGHDPRGLSEKYLASIIEEELLDPKEREFRQTKEKLKQYEEGEKRQKEAEQQRIHKEMERKFSEDYTKQFTDVLDKADLPVTKETIGKMAFYIKKAAEIDKYAMTAEEAAILVRDDFQKTYRSVVASADGEKLLKLLGEDVAAKIRKYDTSKVKDPNQFLKTPENQQLHDRKPRASNKPMTQKEWRDFNRR